MPYRYGIYIYVFSLQFRCDFSLELLNLGLLPNQSAIFLLE